MLLSDAIDLFLGEYISTTGETYRQSLIPMSTFVGSSRPLDQVGIPHMLEWSQYIRTYKTKDGNKYSDATIRKHIKTVRTFFNWCVRLGFIVASPAAAIKQQKVVRQVDEEKAMTDEEFDKLLAYFRLRSKWFGMMQRSTALLLFLGDTGCRAGGAGGAVWDDIDLETKTAVLTEKGDKRNVYYFEDECALELKKWRLRQPKHSGNYVFNREDKPLSAGAIRLILYRACDNVGIRRLGGHSLRHRKGFKLGKSGVVMTTGQLVLNHESIKSTEVYYPKSRALAEEASRRLAHRGKSEEKIIALVKRSQ